MAFSRRKTSRQRNMRRGKRWGNLRYPIPIYPPAQDDYCCDDDTASDDDHDEKDDESFASSSQSLYCLLEELSKKKTCVREDALSVIVERFETNMQHEFAEDNFVTLLYRCRNSVRRGSALEIDLAAQVVGLVAITLGFGENGHEVYEDSLFIFSEALKSKHQCGKILESLAISTLVGARDVEETEISMKTIWQFIQSESAFSVVKEVHPPLILASAISAWTFLLADLDVWRINHKYWKGIIPYFLSLLEEKEGHVNSAVVEALAIIFEKRSIEKFSSHVDDFPSVQEFKNDVIKQVKLACNDDIDISKLLEDGSSPNAKMNVFGDSLTIKTWSKLKQLKFLKAFLGKGFLRHMKENEFLHCLFHFKPKEVCACEELYVPETEEVTVRYFLPATWREDCTQRMFKSPSSLLSKARTQLRNRKRHLVQEERMVLSGAIDEYDM